jgi:hypothetical protein
LLQYDRMSSDVTLCSSTARVRFRFRSKVSVSVSRSVHVEENQLRVPFYVPCELLLGKGTVLIDVPDASKQNISLVICGD